MSDNGRHPMNKYKVTPQQPIRLYTKPAKQQEEKYQDNTENEQAANKQTANNERIRKEGIDTPLQKAQELWKALLIPRTDEGYGKTNSYNLPILLTSENQKQNKHWGDMMQPKNSETFRVYGMNTNGITIDKRGGQMTTICQIHQLTHTDVTCGQEHKLDTTQAAVVSNLQQTIKRHWPNGRGTFATTPITFANSYKPGGTFILTGGRSTGRVIRQDRDKWGRWATHTLRGVGETKVTIISAYQVVQKFHNAVGLITADSQQRTLMAQENGTQQSHNRNPRKVFQQDLQKYIEKCIRNHEEVLLVGDFNEIIRDEDDGMAAVISSTQLIDLFSLRHPSSPPATYARGTQQLDYAWGTTQIANSLTSCGFEPFNYRYHTDHRPYFLDFNMMKLFGNETSPMGKPEARGLSSSNTRQVTAYLEKKHELLTQCNAFERGEKLSHLGDRHKFAEKLDRDIQKASQAAEKKVSLYAEPEWSQKLVKARQKVLILQKCKTMATTKLDHQDIIKEQMAISGVEMLIPSTLAECKHMIKEAKLEVKKIVKASFETRTSERDARIIQLEASKRPEDKKAAKRLRRMKRAEETQQIFKKLKRMRVQQRASGLTLLEIPENPADDPKKCQEWKTIDVPNDIIERLQQRNQEHFGQALGTPFTVSPLGEALGFQGDTEEATKILNGTSQYQQPSDETSESVRQLLKHMQWTEQVQALEDKPTIAYSEFVGKLKVWRESTSTSPSGTHLGHYKTLVAKHNASEAPEEDQEKLRLDGIQKQLCDLHLQMINYALERGYSYQRWQTVANTILFKDPDNYRIHRTRIIHLYEADYNLAIGLKWRSAIHQAEDMKILNDGQYGSRPRRSAQDPVAIEELQYEIARTTRKTMVQVNYDATSCYDRIVPNLGMVVSRKNGVSLNAAKMNSSTLEQAKFHIKTNGELSKNSYQHSAKNPIYGTGQGSGNSPAIWCFLSSLLFDCYDEKAIGAKYCFPDRTGTIEIKMVGFVDDSNGQTNCFTEELQWSEKVMQQHVAHDAQVWTNLLSASGGALELSKCSYHYLKWGFAEHGAPVLMPIRDIPEIKVRDPQTYQTHVLTKLSPYEAHKTLGYYKEPAGNQKKQYRTLLEKSNNNTQFLWKSNITPREAKIFYQSVYLPSMEYALPMSYLQRQQLDRIQKKAMSIIVPKCGYARTTKRAIIYGPVRSGGAGFRQLHVEQAIGQIKRFMRYWRQPETSIGKLLRITLAWTQNMIGTSAPYFQETNQQLPHDESKWMKSVRQALNTMNGKFRLDNEYLITGERDRDTHLMDEILQSKMFTPTEINQLNYCRLYLNVTTIADITMPNGRNLDSSYVSGEPSLQSSFNQNLPVLQEKPSEKAWKIWKKAQTIWSQSDGRLRVPLGKWNKRHHERRNQHFAYLAEQKLYIRLKKGSPRYRVCNQKTVFTYIETEREILLNQIPERALAIQVTGTTKQNQWRVCSTASATRRGEKTNPICATFEEYIDTLDEWEKSLLKHTELLIDPYSASDIISDSFKAVSDGSVLYNMEGSYGWTMRNVHGDSIAQGMGPVTGNQLNSYRAEGVGLLALLRFLYRLAKFTGAITESWEGVIATDSLSILQALAGQGAVDTEDEQPEEQQGAGDTAIYPVRFDVLKADWDVLIEIQAMTKHFPAVKMMHVKGHQDQDMDYEDLSEYAQMNVQADELANQYHQRHGDVSFTAPLMPLTCVQLDIQQGTVTRKFTKTLRNDHGSKELSHHQCTKYGWSRKTYNSIEWEVHGKVLKKRLTQQNHFVKMVNDILPTNAQVNKYDKGKRTCSQCQCKETQDHIMQCPSPTRQKWRIRTMRRLGKALKKFRTDPYLQKLIKQSLQEWLQNDFVDIIAEDYPDHYAAVIQTQQNIGWNQMVRGRWSSEWSYAQQRYLVRKKRVDNTIQDPTGRNSGEQWLQKVINFLWDESLDLWKMRNEEQHGSDVKGIERAARKENGRKLDEIYAMRQFAEPNVQTLLGVDPTIHLEKPTWVVKNWIAMTYPVVKNSVRKAKEKAIQGMRSIKAYFQPG
jgi:exonuclease III